MIGIRYARPQDAATIHDFITQLAVYEREPDAVEVTPAELASQLAEQPPPFECLLAESPEGEPLGFALFFHNYSTWRGRRGLYLEDLFVPPVHRGQGVGLALLQALARLAVARDCARMEWSVLEWNSLAHGFYEKLGARPMTGWRTWRLDGEDLLRLGTIRHEEGEAL